MKGRTMKQLQLLEQELIMLQENIERIKKYQKDKTTRITINRE